MTQKLVIFLLISISFSSCKLKEKYVYFQGNEGANTQFSNGFIPIIQISDYLSITIMGEDKETSVLFNFAQLNNVPMAGYENGIALPNGYTVDKDGNIEMPIIGKIKVGGLTKDAAIAIIQEKVSSFLNSPVVNLMIQNYKVTVLGEVNKPGTYKIPNERMTILEILGLSGDLKYTAQRKNILVIRQTNGRKEHIRVDLTSNDLFDSPAFFLQQNDVVYVEPTKVGLYNSTFWRSNGSIVISAISLLISTVVIITR